MSRRAAFALALGIYAGPLVFGFVVTHHYARAFVQACVAAQRTPVYVERRAFVCQRRTP